VTSSNTPPAATHVNAGNVAIAMAVVVGIALRAYQLGGQIVADDEWHALEALMHKSYAQIASSFGPADYCIPLTLFYKLVSRTVGLTEGWIRAPMFLAGIAALVVLPPLIRSLVGAPASVLFAWLLAICPMHVYFSRYARPYGLTFLLVFVAVIAMFRWQRSTVRAWAIAYIVCGIFAVYLHLIVLPIVFAPILFELGAAILRARPANAPPLRDVVIVGSVLSLGVSSLIGVPLAFDARSMTQKAAAGSVDAGTLVGAFDLLTGTGHQALGLAITLVATIGLASMLRRDCRFALYGVFIVVAQVSAVFVARPVTFVQPIVLARYCFSTLPFLLMATASGVLALAALLRRNWASWVVAGAVLSTMFVCGPIPRTYAYNPNNFTNHPVFQYSYDDSNRYSISAPMRPLKISEFYRSLSRLKPGSTTVVEVPWHLVWGYNKIPSYQAVHRQRIVVGAIGNNTLQTSRWGETVLNSGIDLEHEVHVGDAAGLHKRGVRYVIFHKELAAEFNGPTPPRVDLAAWIARYRQQYGVACYEDSILVVFDIGA
jgi:hypothetical protein